MKYIFLHYVFKENITLENIQDFYNTMVETFENKMIIYLTKAAIIVERIREYYEVLLNAYKQNIGLLEMIINE